MDPIAETQRWLERAVIGLNLCPFAKAAHAKGQVRYALSDARDPRDLLEELGEELLLLRDAPADAIDTTLLVHPQALTDFLDYNDFLADANALVEALELDGVIQVASFHPAYRFAGSEPDDITNCSNRSPFPMLHLLREDSVSRAVAAYPDPDVIVARNKATLRELGQRGWRALMDAPGDGQAKIAAYTARDRRTAQPADPAHRRRLLAESVARPQPGTDMRARIEDVAKRAQVSMKTVSRVLNNESNVRESTRQRVLESVEFLQYRPNLSARSLAGHKSYLLALLYDNPSASYLLEILTGVVETCQLQHYGTVPYPLHHASPGLLPTIEALLLQSKIDGLILTPPITDNDAVLERLDAIGIPYSCISPRKRNGAIGARIDEEGASQQVVAHLASLGHRRIAHIRGDPAQRARAWRLNGYRSGLAAAGLPFDPALVVDGRVTFDSGVLAAETLLDLPQPPTAIFAANDDTAAGVLSVLHQRGLSVPGNVSVCGFDDSPMSAQVFPPLTTVHQPMRDMGKVATEQLLRSLGPEAAGRMVLMPHSLVLRKSTGPAPRA